MKGREGGKGRVSPQNIKTKLYPWAGKILR